MNFRFTDDIFEVTLAVSVKEALPLLCYIYIKSYMPKTLRACVCVLESVYVCVWVCISVCVCACVCVCLFLCICVRVCVCVCVRVAMIMRDSRGNWGLTSSVLRHVTCLLITCRTFCLLSWASSSIYTRSLVGLFVCLYSLSCLCSLPMRLSWAMPDKVKLHV